MSTVLCPHCKAVNRLGTVRCMRCGKPLQAVEVAASRHAQDFARREAQGPFFGAFPEALDFSPASLAVLDALITDMWGEAPLALGVADWQPPPSLMPVVINFGAYLGEVLCRHLPARWEPAPQSPEVVIASRVVDAQGRRINTFAQVAVRFRDGAAANVGMGELYRSLTGRTLPRWQMPRRAVAPREVPAAAGTVAPPAAVDAQALLQHAELHRQRGHHGNAIQTLRRLLQAHAQHRQASRWLIDSLFQAGLPAEGFEVLRALLKREPDDVEWLDELAVRTAHAGQVPEAVQLLASALARGLQAPTLRRRLAFLRLKAGQWSQAQLALEAELRYGDDAELRLGLAQALLRQGQSAAAILHLERVSTLSGCPTALREAARAMLTQIRSEPSPGPSPARDAAAAHYAQAVDHAKAGRFADALPSFLAAAAAAPMRASYLKDVGHCLNDLNRPAEAQSWFERCLALDPGYSQARWMLGQLAERAGRRDQAVAHYRDVLARTDSAQRDVDRAFDRLKALGGLPG